MIVRNRRKRSRLLSRITRALSRIKPPAGYSTLLSTDQFQLEIEKEIQRSMRRKTDPEFAIVCMDFSDHQVSDESLNLLIDDFQERPRVSDSIGWYRMKLAVLLPETGMEGAGLVCDSLVELAEKSDVVLETTISVFPWDDRILGSNEQREMPVNEAGNPEWPSKDSGEMYFFDSSHTEGGVATLERPKISLVKRKKISRGSGVRISFAQTEKTPIWKRAIDVTGAGFGLVLLSPVFLVAALAIKSTSKGPVFFKQEREGKDGDVFNILKFRTMCDDAESRKADLRELSEQDGPAFKLKDDPRITTVGKYLRKSCIDELPQLVNVLTGEMSLVGPRPLPVDESLSCLPWQRQRLSVLPGLTCTWQARGGRDIKFAEWMRMDLEYIQQRGLLFDLKLIGETAVVAVMHKGSV